MCVLCIKDTNNMSYNLPGKYEITLWNIDISLKRRLGVTIRQYAQDIHI